ncbi:hypothetical protein Scep_002411 [Stephania cephalantha]|uniref:Uncharacterized protein n=1 Tax=Stephania cephalantha TaxID=152367 RepID=A0AAP0LCN4_9MAGN
MNGNLSHAQSCKRIDAPATSCAPREIRDTTPCTNKPNKHSPNYIVQLVGNPPAMVGTSNGRID